MKKWSKLLAVGVLVGSALTGCASNDEEAIVVAPLPVIDKQVGVAVNWQYSVGNGVGEYFSKLQPLEAYDKVFAADREGVVVALDKESGKELWKVRLGDNPGSFFKAGQSARLSGGVSAGYDKIYVGSENGVLYVLAQDTGEVVWSKSIGNELMSKPLLAGNKVVVNTGAGKMYALDAETGEDSWSYQQDVPPLSLRGNSSAIEVQGAAFVGLPSGKVGAVLLDSGNVIWESPVTTSTGENELARVIDVDATPIALGGTVYAVAYNGNVAALELRSGRVLWKRSYSAFQSMSIDGFNLYLTTSDSLVYAIDRRSGLELWSQTGLENRGLTAPVVFDGFVAVADNEGYLHLIDRESGTLVGQEEMDSSGYFSRPESKDDRLYLLSRDGELSSLSIKQ